MVSSYFPPMAAIPSTIGVSRKTLSAPQARAEPPINKKWLKYMGCRTQRYGPFITNLSGKDRICPGTRMIRNRAVANRKSPTATMKNPRTATGPIIKCRVAMMAIAQGVYRSRGLTKARIAAQPVQAAFGSKRPLSHNTGEVRRAKRVARVRADLPFLRENPIHYSQSIISEKAVQSIKLEGTRT